MSTSTERSSTSCDEDKDLLGKYKDDHEFLHLPIHRRKASFRLGLKSSLAASFALLLSICFNLYTGLRYHRTVCVTNTQLKPYVVAAPSYSGLEYNKLVEFHAKTDWQSENATVADALWDSIDISPITVAISKKWAAEHGLPESNTFYWDEDKALYHIKGIHGMHCLKYLRHFIIKSGREGKPLASHVVEHMGHCLDSLRQDIMCTADDTLMPGLVEHRLGDKQILQCRDWEALNRWAKDPERDSCFQQISDYKHVAHNLERHAVCPPGSQYDEVSRKYFEIHGHKNLFEPDDEE
ncbi:hypothetical protein F5Y09DRAFT_353642 [Xylaria sp. FL1042]|nr:hypothetical protein F5Y09DRAFT_353642 [Xylaria sp. FL1042]